MSRRLLSVILALLVAVSAIGLAACGSSGGGASTASTNPTATATGEPIKIGFNEGYTGFMAPYAAIIERAILTAMASVDNQVAGRPLVLNKVDNGSDPAQAVVKARQQVADGISVMIGPEYSPSAQAVTAFLARNGGIPQISVFSQPAANLKTANGLAFMPLGIYGQEAYLLGKYCVEKLGYKTSNWIAYDDTASRALEEGFVKGFTEAGGQMLKVSYLAPDVVDFSSYLGSLPKADITAIWIYGNGGVSFIKQYRDYGVAAKIVSLTASANLTESQLTSLGDAAVGIVGVDFASAYEDTPANQEFVKAYRAMWDDQTPPTDAYAAYMATKMFIQAVETNKGDTTPAVIIKTLASQTFDGPTGAVKMSAYQDAYIGKVNVYIVETKQIGDIIGWSPVQVTPNVVMTPPASAQ